MFRMNMKMRKDEDEEAPTSGEETHDTETYNEDQIRKVLSALAKDGKKANRVKLTLNHNQMKNVVMNLTSIWEKKNIHPLCILASVKSPTTNSLASSDRSVQKLLVAQYQSYLST